jgi:trehalose/maltose hydrolase-like predicted phosphorylase
LVIFRDFSDFFGNWKFLVIFLVIYLKVSNILVIAWNSTKYAIMTQPVIKNFNENTCRSMPAKLYIQIASCWPKLSSWIDGILLITPWPGPDYHDAIFNCIYTNSIKKYKWERKTWAKTQFQWWKAFTDFVLPRCFIDFQTLWLTAEI